jgi:hypothetical protein
MEMQVYDCPGLVEVLTLGGITHVVEAYAVGVLESMGSELCTELRIDPTCKPTSLLRHISDAYADLLLGHADGEFRKTVKGLMQALRSGVEEALEELEHDGVGEIPLKFRPWVIGDDGASSAAGGATPLSLEGDSDDEHVEVSSSCSSHQMTEAAASQQQQFVAAASDAASGDVAGVSRSGSRYHMTEAAVSHQQQQLVAAASDVSSDDGGDDEGAGISSNCSRYQSTEAAVSQQQQQLVAAASESASDGAGDYEVAGVSRSGSRYQTTEAAVSQQQQQPAAAYDATSDDGGDDIVAHAADQDQVAMVAGGSVGSSRRTSRGVKVPGKGAPSRGRSSERRSNRPTQAPFHWQEKQQLCISGGVRKEETGAFILPEPVLPEPVQLPVEDVAGRFRAQLKQVFEAGAAAVDMQILIQDGDCISSSSTRAVMTARDFDSYVCKPLVGQLTANAAQGSSSSSSPDDSGGSSSRGVNDDKGNEEDCPAVSGHTGRRSGDNSDSSSCSSTRELSHQSPELLPRGEQEAAPSLRSSMEAGDHSSNSSGGILEYRLSEKLTYTAELTRTSEVVFHPSGSSSSLGANGMALPYTTDADAQAAKETGVLGEAFVYAVFSKHLPGFGPDNWHTGNRSYLGQGLLGPAVEPPYDFLYDDIEGKLTNRAGTRCFIEVKSTRDSIGDNPMHISTNEWELAQKVHNGDGSAVYIVVRVAGVCAGGQPHIAAVYKDPVTLLHEGKLGLTGQELLLVPGHLNMLQRQ